MADGGETIDAACHIQRIAHVVPSPQTPAIALLSNVDGGGYLSPTFTLTFIRMPDFPEHDLRAGTPVALRLADDDREGVVSRLSDAYARDVISVEEFEQRLDGVYKATDRHQLDALVRDLPVALPALGESHSSGSVVPAGGTRRIAAWFSNVERTGFTDIPRRLDIRVLFGNVELDLTQTNFPIGVTEISIKTTFGNVELFLPPGVVVENDGAALLGSFDCHAPSAQRRDGAAVATLGNATSTPSSRIVRITGRAILSSVEVTQIPEGA